MLSSTALPAVNQSERRGSATSLCHIISPKSFTFGHRSQTFPSAQFGQRRGRLILDFFLRTLLLFSAGQKPQAHTHART